MTYNYAWRRLFEYTKYEPGWFVGPDEPHTPLGGPLDLEGLEAACTLLSLLNQEGVPCPAVCPLPHSPSGKIPLGVFLEWSGEDQPWSITAERTTGEEGGLWYFHALNLESELPSEAGYWTAEQVVEGVLRLLGSEHPPLEIRKEGDPD